MTYPRRSRRAGLVVAIACAAAAMSLAASAAASDANVMPLQRQTFAMNLGGPSGTYTDWQMTGVREFRELSATIDVTKVYGKPRDKWAAMLRLALDDAGTGRDRRSCSLLLIHDRREKTRSAVWEVGGEQGRIGFELPATGTLTFKLSRIAADRIRVAWGEDSAEVPCALQVAGIRALGSGVDVTIEKLELVSGIGAAP